MGRGTEVVRGILDKPIYDKKTLKFFFSRPISMKLGM